MNKQIAQKIERKITDVAVKAAADSAEMQQIKSELAAKISNWMSDIHGMHKHADDAPRMAETVVDIWQQTTREVFINKLCKHLEENSTQLDAVTINGKTYEGDKGTSNEQLKLNPATFETSATNPLITKLMGDPIIPDNLPEFLFKQLVSAYEMQWRSDERGSFQ